MIKLPISAIVVSLNEGELLKNCLKSISFCQEIIVVDLGSSDQSLQIAEKYADRIFNINRIDIVEKIRKWSIGKTKFDWVLLTDPDERYNKSLVEDLKNIFFTIPNNVGIVNLPIQYFVFNYFLKGTIWGGTEKYRQALINKKKVEISENVHHGFKLNEGNNSLKIHRSTNNYILHKWLTNINLFLQKHKRYIANEGKAKYSQNKVYSFKLRLIESLRGFKRSFIYHNGYKDHLIGFALSCFWSWYIYKSWGSLKKYEKKIRRKANI